MTVHVHALDGCHPVPLAHYLKALGVLRLVARQADDQCRGWWSGEQFRLATKLDEAGLTGFFLESYEPTPILAPWNGGSGFYPKDNQQAINTLAADTSSRFSSYRSTISACRRIVGDRPERPEGDDKAVMIRRCRELPAPGFVAWLDAAVVLAGDGSPEYPSLLGTGGNDRRLDFTNNFMQRLVELFLLDPPARRGVEENSALLRQSLFGGAVPGLLGGAAIGQFLPGSAGGPNSTAGFDADSLVNPWDFILMLEGTIAFAVGISRRDEMTSGALAAPFATRSIAAGYGSAATADDGGRGEQWMPLWSRPARWGEVGSILAEARCQVGRRPAVGSLDAALAITRLGVARGIDRFERYGFAIRNGLSNFATPLGRWQVGDEPLSRLIDEVTPWLDMYRRCARDDRAPAGVSRAIRRCDATVLDCCRRPSPRSWQSILLSLAAAELQLVRSPRWTGDKPLLGPLRSLSSEWIAAADDRSAEFRLACALACIQLPRATHGQGRSWTVRDFVLSLDEQPRRFLVRDDTIASSPHVVASGTDLVVDTIAIIRRVLLFSGELRAAVSMVSAGASVSDIRAFVDDNVDDKRIWELARVLALVRWADWHRPVTWPAADHDDTRHLASFAVLRLAHSHSQEESTLAWGDAGPNVRIDPACLARLDAGDLHTAISIASRRLTAAGVRPRVRRACGGARLARRLAAALLFPLSPDALRQLATFVTRGHMADTTTPAVLLEN
ncbi:MAG: type I-U CRISPR-associated protein Csx17 [Phycisphaerales bacterium]